MRSFVILDNACLDFIVLKKKQLNKDETFITTS